MFTKTHLAEIKFSDYEAILAGLIEAIRQDGPNQFISRCIALMKEAKTPTERETMLRSVIGELEFSFPVAIILELGDETYKGFETRLTRLEDAGWMGPVFADLAFFIRLYLLDCETRGEKSYAVRLIKATRLTFFSLRKALTLAGIPDNYEKFRDSAKEILSA